jgi:hypothetical protein
MDIRRITWRGPPLALQIMALLLGGLVVAQLVTLFLTLILPPEPKAQYNLEDVAAVLAGRDPADGGGTSLQRSIEAGPPQISGPGWLGSEKSRADLARLVGADRADVMLAFYTPLPFAGTTQQRSYAMADDGFVAAPAALAGYARPAGFVLAQFQPPPPGGGGGFPSGPPPFPQNFPPPSGQPPGNAQQFPVDHRGAQVRPERTNQQPPAASRPKPAQTDMAGSRNPQAAQMLHP